LKKPKSSVTSTNVLLVKLTIAAVPFYNFRVSAPFLSYKTSFTAPGFIALLL
jgi:hypothetical protein